jgi:hypothetical protein
VAVLALLALPARAHHGVAAVGLGGADGPGAALETSSPLTLPQGTLLLLGKLEEVRFRQRASPALGDKEGAAFGVLAVGYGLTPWLSAYLFQPYAVKAQVGLGRNAGAGDPNLMLTLGWKWDGGPRLLPERESLDDLTDWHFSAWAASTLPLGPTRRRDALGGLFAPDMQTGFGAPSPALGGAAMKQLGDDLTLLADLSHQRFLAHASPSTRYRFGGETRLDAALSWRAWWGAGGRLDLCGELLGLRLERDAEEAGPGGPLVALRGSGGAILYGALGLRFTRGALSIGLGLKRPLLADLNERSLQQGAEGLETLRAALTLAWSTGT